MNLAGPSLCLLLTVSSLAPAADFDFQGLAIVRDDGSLLIRNRVAHLFGIHLPQTNRQCRSWISPVLSAQSSGSKVSDTELMQ